MKCFDILSAIFEMTRDSVINIIEFKRRETYLFSLETEWRKRKPEGRKELWVEIPSRKSKQVSFSCFLSNFHDLKDSSSLWNIVIYWRTFDSDILLKIIKMGDSKIDPSVVKKTQDMLGKIIKKPPLTEKLLSKPPFRFLHDLCTSVSNYFDIFYTI